MEPQLEVDTPSGNCIDSLFKPALIPHEKGGL